ncbi:MAG: caspase family protein [Rectinema subterraneum]|jgi:hypothetical protein
MRSEIKTMEQRLHKHMKAPGSLRASSRLRSPAWRATLLGAAILALLLAGCELFPSNASVFSGKKYAIVVGINDYIDPRINDLNYCVPDANSISTMLAGWTVKLITAQSNESINKYATKSKLKAAFDNVPQDAQTFLFYYSGHGDGGYLPEEAYIIPSDYNGNFNTMISSEELLGWLAGISANNKVVIFDSCFSGGFVQAPDSLDAVPGNYTKGNKSSSIEMFLRFGELLSRNWEARVSGSNDSSAPLVISAAGWAEKSLEPDPATKFNNVGHGYFTYYLLEAASKDANSRMKGDADGDNVLSCLEAYSYAKTALESSGYDFLPHISGGLRDFALIDNRGN